MFSRRKPDPTDPALPSMQAMKIADGQLQATALAVPHPQPHEILIQVRYIGVNRADLLQVEGSYAPPEGASPLPGLEVSGTIAALGSEVVGWTLGEEVCALLSGGGYAEYAAVPATQVLPLPHRLSLMQAASLPEATATAFIALGLEAQLKTGDRVLVHGAASGVGIIMAQVARAWGATVYGTVGGPEKAKFVKQYGVRPIDTTQGPFLDQILKDTRNEGVDVIIDILGGPQLATHFKLLRKGGRMVSLAFMEGNLAESVKLGSLLMKGLTWSGTTLRNKSAEEKAAIIDGVRHRIWPHLATGAIVPALDRNFPLQDAALAHQRMQERLHCGKILLEVAPESE